MTDEIDGERIAEAVEEAIRDADGPMAKAGYAVTALADMGEIYLRAPDGSHWRMLVEPVAGSDVEGWGIDFDA